MCTCVRACVRMRACSVRIQGSRPGIMWTCIVSITSIAPIVSEREGLVLGLIRTHENRRSFQNRNRRLRSGSRPSHLNVVLSKAALSGPSVCLRARAPCPLRASCFGADRAESRVLLRSVWLQQIAPSSCSGVLVHHPPGSRGRAARAAGLRSGGSLGQDRLLARRSAHALTALQK